MANTLGGTILIGVNEENDRPKPPFIGLIAEKSEIYRSKIENITRMKIVPPPFIEVTNCSNGAKAFVVIRLPPSFSTPHSLSDGLIYVRTGQSSNPEEIMSPDQIAWLYERRQKSIDLKNYLYTRSWERFSNFLSELGFGWRGSSNAILSLSVYPSIPQHRLFSYVEANALLEKIATESQLTRFNNKKTRAISGGALNATEYINPFSAFLLAYGDRALEGVFNYLEPLLEMITNAFVHACGVD